MSIGNPLSLLLGNPVVLKELRGRMRGPRAFIVLTGYLSLVGGFAILLYLVAVAGDMASTTRIDGGDIGRMLFRGVVGIQLFLVTFIAPAFTAGAISGERERQTYDLLRTTLLPESRFVMGKLFSALAYVFLLLLSAIPLQSLSFILGGTDLPDMIIAILILTVMAVFLGTMGVFFSARMRKTLPASIATYSVAFGLVIGTGIILGVYLAIKAGVMKDLDNKSTETMLTLWQQFWILLNPIATLEVTRNYLVNEQTPWTYTYTYQSTGAGTVALPQPWITFSILYSVISLIFFWLTVRTIKK